MAKSVKEDLASLLQMAKEEKRDVPVQMVVPVDNKKLDADKEVPKYIPFSFTVDRELILYVKNLVLQKIKEDVNNYFYNESTAIKEGIDLLKISSPVPKRPVEIGTPTKSGRGVATDKKIIKVSTSFLLSEEDKEFVYDYIYHQQRGGGRYTKEEFFNLIVEKLKEKYN